MLNNWDVDKARNGKMVNHTYSARSGVASALKVSGEWRVCWSQCVNFWEMAGPGLMSQKWMDVQSQDPEIEQIFIQK